MISAWFYSIGAAYRHRLCDHIRFKPAMLGLVFTNCYVNILECQHIGISQNKDLGRLEYQNIGLPDQYPGEILGCQVISHTLYTWLSLTAVVIVDKLLMIVSHCGFLCSQRIVVSSIRPMYQLPVFTPTQSRVVTVQCTCT